MREKSPTIEFFFEFASPYSYLAARELPKLAARHGTNLNWRPIDLREVWRLQGVLEPYTAIRRFKSNYIAKDATRVALTHGVNLTFPKGPEDPGPARLVFYALSAERPDQAVAFAQAVWLHRFSGNSIREPGDLLRAFPVLSESFVDAACEDPRAAARLTAANAAAASNHCFGVPWMVCGSEAYFGQDRLYLLEAALDRALPRHTG